MFKPGEKICVVCAVAKRTHKCDRCYEVKERDAFETHHLNNANKPGRTQAKVCKVCMELGFSADDWCLEFAKLTLESYWCKACTGEFGKNMVDLCVGEKSETKKEYICRNCSKTHVAAF
jgi:hypothetical protein